MDLTTLKYIVTIAEERQLSKAAERVFVTSSALSQCVKKIEHDLGVSLFEKADGRTFLLTNAGRIYVEAAKRMLKIKEEAYREIHDVHHEGRGRFTLGISPRRGEAMFSNIFPMFHKAYPNVSIDLVEASQNTLYRRVLDGTVDIAVITPSARELEAIGHEMLDQEEIMLMIPVAHPYARRAGAGNLGWIQVSELSIFKDDAWLLCNKESMHRNITDEIFGEAGFFPEKVLLETSSTNPQLIAVEEGIAVGLIPTPRVDVSARVARFHLTPPKTRRLYATYRKSYRLSVSQRFMIDEIKKFYALPIDDALPPYRLDW